jgi:NADH-quinone oxidoreductase subunit J
MELTSQQIVFFILAAVIIICSILTVTTRRILRAATYLLFVLFATAGLYFQLNYTFLGAVQLTIYAGGIIVLYVFSILLTSSDADKKEPLRNRRKVAGLIASAVGVALSLFLLLSHTFPEVMALSDAGELSMKTIGYTMMGTGKYQYLLPFELVSVLLLACIVGGLMIARKRQ